MSVFSNTFFFSVISGNGGVSSLTSSGSLMGVVSSSISGSSNFNISCRFCQFFCEIYISGNLYQF
jgi:hypothetical protein